jgi:type I restriction-modification system specificity protein
MVKLTAKFSFMEEYKLSDIAEVRTGPFGSQLHNEDYVSTGTPIVTVEHLGNRRFSKQNLPLVSDDDKKRLSKYLLQEGDIVFSRVGSVDRCSYVTSAENDWLFSGRCLRVRCGNNCHPLFLYYYFCKESVKQYIKSIAVGATMPSINTKLMAEIPILLPKLEEQRCIADILSSFDDKIELNRRINDNLEQQAQALFKSWFVDFEPFRGGEFVDSELGLIPKGWRVVSLGEVTKQITEKVGNREDVTVLSPINSGELVLSEEYFTKQVFSKDLSKYLIVNPLSFAYNPARINIGSIGLNTFDFVGCVSPVYVVFECEPNYQYFFDFFKRTAMFKDEVALRAIGGVRQSLGYNDLSLIKIIYPTSDVVVEFNNLYLKMKEVMIKNTDQNEKFISLRDSLLPKLMSGELKINEFNC